MTMMTILFLGEETSPLLAWLRSHETTVIQTSEKIDTDFLQAHHVDLIVSYGYRHIIREPVLQMLPGRAINLHVSLLPFNRGSDPNFWSFFDGTPKGVTIHHIDAGLDTGDIIVQREIEFPSSGVTLESSYAMLQSEIQRLLIENWNDIRAGVAPRSPQEGPGSSHRSSERLQFDHLLTDSWRTPVNIIEEAGSANRAGWRVSAEDPT